MARGATKSEEVNELTKQIIAEIVAEEYADKGITSDPSSLYTGSVIDMEDGDKTKKKKDMPTVSSWYERLEKKAAENDNDT